MRLFVNNTNLQCGECTPLDHKNNLPTSQHISVSGVFWKIHLRWCSWHLQGCHRDSPDRTRMLNISKEALGPTTPPQPHTQKDSSSPIKIWTKHKNNNSKMPGQRFKNPTKTTAELATVRAQCQIQIWARQFEERSWRETRSGSGQQVELSKRSEPSHTS